MPPEDYIDMNNCYISEVNSFKFDIDSECVISNMDFQDVSVNFINVKQNYVPNLMAAVILNGQVRHEMVIDTAAAQCIISYDIFK